MTRTLSPDSESYAQVPAVKEFLAQVSTYIAEQEDIFRKQVEKMDKPDKVKAGIVKGKIGKHLSEIVLLDQGFVREEKKKCSEILASLSKELGTDVTITDFLYFKVGEEL